MSMRPLSATALVAATSLGLLGCGGGDTSASARDGAVFDAPVSDAYAADVDSGSAGDGSATDGSDSGSQLDSGPACPNPGQWDPEIQLSAHGAHLAASGSTLHWASAPIGPGDLRYRRSMDEGSTWSPEVLLASNAEC